ncbi:hypothetical protein FRB97_003981 [Tulasnella sp. 331]|nr:hypothetical protein FRB97_003981 [Tulasnella sp. 331]
MDSTQRKRKRNAATTSASYSHIGGLTHTTTRPESSSHPGPTVHVQVREAHLVLADHPSSESGTAAAVENRDRSGIRVGGDGDAISIDEPVEATLSSGRAGLISWKCTVGLNSEIFEFSLGVDGSMEADHLRAEDDIDDVWVDRFDALLLITSLPSITTSSQPSTAAALNEDDETWSNLPSDSEDTFFLTPLETRAYHRDKRLRAMDRLRDERMRALEAQEAEERQRSGATAFADEDVWGGDDEEPTSQPQLDLMSRTAKHILSSPNPTQLESRILANHGMDPRFAFLRGRWKRRWEAVKADVINKTKATRPVPAASSSSLVMYGSGSESDSEAGSDSDTRAERKQGTGDVPGVTSASKGGMTTKLNESTAPSYTDQPESSSSSAPVVDVDAQEAKRARLPNNERLETKHALMQKYYKRK